MFSFLHRLIVSLHKTLIYHQKSRGFILCCLKIFFTVQLKEKVTYIFDDLRVSKLTAHFHFWVNYPFKASENDLFAIKTRILKFLPIPIPDSLTPAAKSTQRQNNESALDSQQMLNLQEITHNHCSNSNVWNVQEFKHLKCSKNSNFRNVPKMKLLLQCFQSQLTERLTLWKRTKKYKCCNIKFMLLSSTD